MCRFKLGLARKQDVTFEKISQFLPEIGLEGLAN